MKQPVRHLSWLKQNGRVCSTCTTMDIILDGKIAKTKNDHKIYGRFYQHSTVAPPIERLSRRHASGGGRHPAAIRRAIPTRPLCPQKQHPSPATSVAANA